MYSSSRFFWYFGLNTFWVSKNSLGLGFLVGQVILAMVGQMNADVTNCQGGGLAVPIVRPAGNKSPALISPHNWFPAKLWPSRPQVTQFTKLCPNCTNPIYGACVGHFNPRLAGNSFFSPAELVYLLFCPPSVRELSTEAPLNCQPSQRCIKRWSQGWSRKSLFSTKISGTYHTSVRGLVW